MAYTTSMETHCVAMDGILVLSVLYYKPVMIVNDDSSIINKLETSLTDDVKVVIYDRRMFIVQVTGSSENIHLDQLVQGS
jgi:hypothetical protein